MQINKELLEKKLRKMLEEIKAGTCHSTAVCLFEDGGRQVQLVVTADEEDFIEVGTEAIIQT